MLVNALARAGLVLMVGALLPAIGCRASTDRIRVLEAERAEAERRNRELQHQQAELRAEMIKAEGAAEAERARAEALSARLELAQNRPAPSAPETPTRIDVEALRRAFAGTGAVVNQRPDGGATITLASDITFRAGRADLNKKAQSTLDRVAKALREVAGVDRLRIEGHTDADPIRKSGWGSNEELSLARANTVRKFLVAKGIDDQLLEVEGYGAANPVEPNTTPSGKARNRRVEIVLITQH